MPQLARFETSLPSEMINTTKPILSVKVGPSHINFGNHADHASLAEVAHHALSLGRKKKDKDKEFSTGLTINYINETHLGDTLEWNYFDDKVYVTRTTGNHEKVRMIVFVAK